MNCFESLLESLGVGGLARASRIGESGRFALVLDDDVAVTLSMSECDEYCLLTANLAVRLPANPDAAALLNG